MHAFVHDIDPAAPVGADGIDSTDVLIRVGGLARMGGPRFGLIVSKAVGPAVVRHRVARRLRHICAEIHPELPTEADIVIRALPGSATLGSDELRRQLHSGLRKLGVPLNQSR